MCCVYSKYTYVLHHTCLYPAKNRLYSDLDCTTAFSCYLLHFGRLHTNNKRPYIGTSDNIPARIVIESDNPLSYEIIDDEEIPPYESDADTLGGRPASDYVTNDKLEGYVKDSELEEALSGLATTAFEPYEGEEPPETLDAGKGIITTDDRLYVGSRSNKPIEVITLAHELNIGTINGKTMEQIIDYLTEQVRREQNRQCR